MIATMTATHGVVVREDLVTAETKRVACLSVFVFFFFFGTDVDFFHYSATPLAAVNGIELWSSTTD